MTSVVEPSRWRRAWSLRRRLLGLVLVATVAMWLASAAIIYHDAENASQDLFDQSLAETAHLLLSLAEHEGREAGSAGVNPLIDTADGQHSAFLFFQIWNRDGKLVYRAKGAPATPFVAGGNSGYGWIDGADGRWRTYAAWNGAKTLQVQVGEPTTHRREISAAFGNRIAPFALLSLPAILALLWWLIHRAIAPIGVSTEAVAARTPGDLRDVDSAGAPEELQPLYQELNRLLGQVRNTLERERRFTADAAHELRTPLAAIRTHVQVIGRARDPAQQREAVADALAGVDRSSHLVDQLLTLARLEHDDPGTTATAKTDLAAIAQAQCAEQAGTARARNIELNVDCRPATMLGDPVALGILLRNLIDNALRYTPSGGRVEVEVHPDDGGVRLRVSDDGRGIPQEQRERVFDRFFRIAGNINPGSGLGLSIVRRIVERHGARITVLDGVDGHGTCFSVFFPLV